MRLIKNRRSSEGGKKLFTRKPAKNSLPALWQRIAYPPIFGWLKAYLNEQ
jgi:hypothetical protein